MIKGYWAVLLLDMIDDDCARYFHSFDHPRYRVQDQHSEKRNDYAGWKPAFSKGPYIHPYCLLPDTYSEAR